MIQNFTLEIIYLFFIIYSIYFVIFVEKYILCKYIYIYLYIYNSYTHIKAPIKVQLHSILKIRSKYKI